MEFSKDNEIWTINGLKLVHANVLEVCKKGDIILYRVDKEIYTDDTHPHPYIVDHEVAYTEEEAITKLIELYNVEIDRVFEHLIELSTQKRKFIHYKDTMKNET